MSWRRLIVLLLVLAVIAVPAVALRAMCVGNSCDRVTGGAPRVPFCPLPDDLKSDLAAGYREGRSPDVLAVTRAPSVWGPADASASLSPWPSLGGDRGTEVPIVFAGTGIDPSVALPDGTTLDEIAPTVADAIGFDRPFPSVRSGHAVLGLASDERPRLVLEVALKGVGSGTLEEQPGAWPFLGSLIGEGAGTTVGLTASLPVDPTATLTTIGTGGLPSQHGITGTFVRNDDGLVTEAWGPAAPVSIIATLPDDWDEQTDQRARIGLVATAGSDRGLTGGTWYPGHDRDRVLIGTGRAAVDATRELLASGFGRDDVTDILGVVLDGSLTSMDQHLRQIVELARAAAPGSVLVVVAGIGPTAGPGPSAAGLRDLMTQVEDQVPGDRPVIAQAVTGGFFLDQTTLTAGGITGQAVVDATLDATSPDGETMTADAFQGFAVSFARYC